jgi:hypothetical protein
LTSSCTTTGHDRKSECRVVVHGHKYEQHVPERNFSVCAIGRHQGPLSYKVPLFSSLAILHLHLRVSTRLLSGACNSFSVINDPNHPFTLLQSAFAVIILRPIIHSRSSSCTHHSPISLAAIESRLYRRAFRIEPLEKKAFFNTPYARRTYISNR